jgi:hypothetical protein
MDDWVAYFREAELAFDEAVAHLVRLWLQEQVMSEGVREAIETTRLAHARFEERLTAFNAFMEAN